MRTHAGEKRSTFITNLPLSEKIASIFISRAPMKMRMAMREIKMIIADFPTVAAIIIDCSTTAKRAQVTACTGINVLGDNMIGVRMKRWTNGLATVPTCMDSTSRPAEGNSFRGWALEQTNIGVAISIGSIIISGAMNSRGIVYDAIEPACRMTHRTMMKTMTARDYVMTTVNVARKADYASDHSTSRWREAAPSIDAQGMSNDARKMMIIETLIIAGATIWMTMCSPLAQS